MTREEHRIIEKLLWLREEIIRKLRYLDHLLALLPASEFIIKQEGHMAIKGIVSGQSGHFVATPNGALQAGNVPVFSVDDPAVVLTQSADGLSVDAAVPLADVQGSAPAGSAPSFNLTESGVNSAGQPIKSSVAVPILPVPPAPATAFDIEQTS